MPFYLDVSTLPAKGWLVIFHVYNRRKKPKQLKMLVLEHQE